MSAVDGQVTLDANGAASDLLVNNVVTTAAGSGSVSLEADNDVIFAAAGDVTAGGAGTVAVTADADDGGEASGELFMDNGTLIDAGSGTIALSADENITLGGC